MKKILFLLLIFAVSLSAQDAVQKTITGLTKNTTYYWRVIAVNDSGRSEGETKTFTTLGDAVPGTELTLNGNFETGGLDNFTAETYGDNDSVAISTTNVIDGNYSVYIRTDVGGGSGFFGRPLLYWTLSEDMVVGETYIFSFRADKISGDPRIYSRNIGLGYQVVQEQITDNYTMIDTFVCTAEPALPYYVYIYLDGSNYTGDFTCEVSLKKFTEEASAPTVATSPADLIATTSARLKGTVNPNGASTAAKFLYGTSTGVYTDSATATQSPLTGSLSQSITYSLTGLTENTTYYYIAVGTNSEGRVEGSEQSFTTLDVDYSPLVSTDGSSSIDTTFATLNGTVNANGLSTIARVLYGTSSGTYTDSAAYSGNPVTGSSYTEVAQQVTGLSPGTLYYFKWIAGNDSGRTEGIERSFTTVSSGGTIYYISSSDGNDSYTGLSSSTPWQSLSKLHSSWNLIVPGDKILFKRGDEWAPSSLSYSDGVGVIKIPNWKDGTSSAYITMGAYGSLSDPIPNISGKNLGSTFHQVMRTGPLHYWRFENLRFEGEFAMYSSWGDDQNPDRGIGYVIIEDCEFDGRVNKPTRLSFVTGWSIYIHTQVPDSNNYANLGWYPAATHDVTIKGNTFWNSSGEDCINMVCVGDNIYVGYNQFYGSNEEFLDIAAGENHVVEYNFASGAVGNGMKFHSQFNPLRNLTFRGNVIVKGNNIGNAAAFENIRDSKIYNNTLAGYDNGWSCWFGDMDRTGLYAYYSTFGNNEIKNNIFFGSIGVYGIWNGVSDGGFFTDNTISNNTYYLIPNNDLYYAIRIRKSTGDVQIRMDQTALFASEWTDKASGGTSEKMRNPLLVNPFWTSAEVFGDFRLATGSNEIDSGTNITGYNYDIDGNPVPVNGTTDRGAYEKQ